MPTRLFEMEDYNTPHPRPTWKSTRNSIVAFAVFTVGLNNYWRFPNSLYLNGGGAFAYPYLIMMILIGRPMYYLDMALGQFSGKGNPLLFRSLGKAWMGLGISQCILSFFEAVNYSFLLTIAVFYISNTFNKVLPWTYCRDDWIGCTTNFTLTDRKTMFTPAEYFLRENIRRSHMLKAEGIGLPDWRVCLCSLFTWATVYITLFRGPVGVSYLSWASLVLPYILLFILLCSSNGKAGASLGMAQFLTPEWSALLHPKTWISALTQCLVSLGIGAGPVISIASYNHIHCDIGLISIVIVVIDILTSFMCGFTLFAGIGHLAHVYHVRVSDILTMEGYVIIFIYYEQVVEMYGNPHVYAMILFILLFCLGHGPLCGYTLCMITSLSDLFPKIRMELLTLMVCSTCYILTIAYCTNLQEVLHVMVDMFCNLYVLTFIALMQLVAVMYVYGLKYLCWDMEYIRSHTVPLFLRWMWTVVAPVLMLFVYFNAIYEPPQALVHEYLPSYGYGITICIMMMMATPIPICIIIAMIQNRSLGCRKLRLLFASTHWLPVRVRDAESVILFRQLKMVQDKAKGLDKDSLRHRVYHMLVHRK